MYILDLRFSLGSWTDIPVGAPERGDTLSPESASTLAGEDSLPVTGKAQAGGPSCPAPTS